MMKQYFCKNKRATAAASFIIVFMLFLLVFGIFIFFLTYFFVTFVDELQLQNVCVAGECGETLQKFVESFSSENKPHIFIVGHYHKAEFLPLLRNVICFQAGCFQAQTPFAVRRNLPFHYGGWICQLGLNKDGISSVRAEFIPFYRPISDDYRNYE